jgi:hypothetical protein
VTDSPAKILKSINDRLAVLESTSRVVLPDMHQRLATLEGYVEALVAQSREHLAERAAWNAERARWHKIFESTLRVIHEKELLLSAFGRAAATQAIRANEPSADELANIKRAMAEMDQTSRGN